MTGMRRSWLLIVVLVVAFTAYAKERDWQEANVMTVSTEPIGNGAMAYPIGTSAMAFPIIITRTFYDVRTPEVSYTLSRRSRKVINLTVGGKTKLAIEGNHAFVIDNAGKEVKLDIVRKAAR
jgi:hypothetical protein